MEEEEEAFLKSIVNKNEFSCLAYWLKHTLSKYNELRGAVLVDGQGNMLTCMWMQSLIIA